MGKLLPKTLQFWAFFAKKLFKFIRAKNGIAVFITVWLNVKRWVILITFISRCRLFVLKASSINNKMGIFWIGSKLGENLLFIIMFEYKVMLERPLSMTNFWQKKVGCISLICSSLYLISD